MAAPLFDAHGECVAAVGIAGSLPRFTDNLEDFKRHVRKASEEIFETARGKAMTAAAFRRPTTEMLDSIRNNPAFWASLGRLEMVPGAGGYPLTRDGVLFGAIGCGRGIGDHDEQCAEAGARAVNS